MDKTTIEVSASQSLSMAVDQVNLLITVKALKREYKAAVLDMHRQTGRIKEALTTCGIERDKLITSSFTIDRKTEYDKETKTTVAAGYEASHEIDFSIPFSQSRLGDVLRAVGTANVEVDIALRFWAANQQNYEQTLLQEAWHQVRKTAEVLALASQRQLGMPILIQINDGFSRSERHYGADRIDFMGFKAIRAMPDPDINPEHTQLSCELTVRWELAE